MDAARKRLLEAAAAGDVGEVRLALCAEGTDQATLLNCADAHGWTALMLAVERLDLGLVRLLLDAGADVLLRSSADSMSVLHVLAESDRRSWDATVPTATMLARFDAVLHMLVAAGADPNASNAAGESVLHLLALRGHTNAVREMLTRGLVVVDAVNTHGDTPLHYASRKGHTEIVKLLLAHGASLSAQSQFGTPDQVASEFQQTGVAALLRQGLTFVAKDSDATGIWSLPPELVLHMLSFLGTPQDFCAVSQTCRAMAAISRDDHLWRPLGHESWADHHVPTEGGWKQVYMKWLRAAISLYVQGKQAEQLRLAGDNKTPSKPTTAAGAKAGPRVLKLLFSGDCGAGKSSMLQRYAENSFIDKNIPTIGVDFKIVMYDHFGEPIKVQLWDTAGPERFRTITSAYYRGAHGVLVVYDVTNRRSFDGVLNWVNQVRQFGTDGCPVLLVGCKADLEADRVIGYDEGLTLARALGAIFAECSSKTGEGVQEAVNSLVGWCLGGWRCVAGLGQPAHVPPEAVLDACIEAAGLTPAGSNKKPSCCLQ